MKKLKALKIQNLSVQCGQIEAIHHGVSHARATKLAFFSDGIQGGPRVLILKRDIPSWVFKGAERAREGVHFHIEKRRGCLSITDFSIATGLGARGGSITAIRHITRRQRRDIMSFMWSSLSSWAFLLAGRERETLFPMESNCPLLVFVCLHGCYRLCCYASCSMGLLLTSNAAIANEVCCSPTRKWSSC